MIWMSERELAICEDENMEIEIKALTPDFVEDYIDFLIIELFLMVHLIIRATAMPLT